MWLERNLKPGTEWRAAGIHARSLEIFARYGLIDKFLEAGNPFTEFRAFLNGENRPAVAISAIRTEFPMLLGCGQDTTERILRERLEELDVQVRWGWEYLAYEAIDDNQMLSVQLKKVGSDNDEIIIRLAPYLMGCDGGHSKIRKAIGATFEGKLVDSRLAVCDIEFDVDWLPVAR
jgi:2-polyprenyl-6-methoxyphenol hydroxylase-like FAD-dependent oxidoreductase